MKAVNDNGLIVRECTSVEEFDACVRLQREAFGLPDMEISPRRHMIVSRSAGGWVLGAFAGERLVGFVLHLAAVRGEEIFGYSHMMAVAASHQNRGVGARLKWAQRERALSEGRAFIKWTFEPLRARNAHFNLVRLGVVVRAYEVNYYGTDYATQSAEQGQHQGLDSDRLVAEWDLRSPRVEALARRADAPASANPRPRSSSPPTGPRSSAKTPSPRAPNCSASARSSNNTSRADSSARASSAIRRARDTFSIVMNDE